MSKGKTGSRECQLVSQVIPASPPALMPLALCISHACLALFFSLKCQPPSALPACQAAPNPLSSVWFPPIWPPHWVPRAAQPPGNSNRWGGTASLTDGPTEAGLLQQSSLGNQRQKQSYHGCLLNRDGRWQGDEKESRAFNQPQAGPALWEWVWRGRAAPMLFHRPRILLGVGAL